MEEMRSALLVACVSLLACGSGDPEEQPIDGAAGNGSADADPCMPYVGGESCNPITQQGCAEGERCTFVRFCVVPAGGQTDCVPDGTVEEGGACVAGIPGPDTGYDDCVRGAICVDGTCHSICAIEPDTCTEGTCLQHEDLFTDDDSQNTGACDS
jgi:hypothetical protein